MFNRVPRSLLVYSLFAITTAYSGIVTVSFDSGGMTITDNLSTPLSSGSPTIDGDGFVLQLGYYSSATAANNFLGTWIPLTGFSSLNTGSIPGTTIGFNQTTVGDNQDQGAGAAGTFALTLTFDESDSTKNNSFPAIGTPLAVRFYDASTLTVGVTRYNAFSIDTGFTWAAPADSPSQPILGVSLDDVGVEWESGGGDAGKTALVFVPEPSSAGFLFAGLAALCFRRRKGNA